MNYFILGTAGHIDHGKTTLVKALTGVDTDRLKEEKKRGITIELGFAPLDLGNDVHIGIVDVPGHERFVHHMLAGAAGIDLVMLIVAADEGVMPQTREHLDIIQLLGVKKGLIVLTKVDLVDEEWLKMVKVEIQELVQDTKLSESPILEVSAFTGQGIFELKNIIKKIAQETESKVSKGNLRLPIDRVFTLQGIGTVVTGTLFNGIIQKGEFIEILPEKLKLRVRNIHVHGKEVNQAIAGQRVAVNLANVEVNDIMRGSVLVKPETTLVTQRLDAEIKLIKGLDKPLTNGRRVHFHIGTKQVLARVLLLDRDELKSGESCFAQFVLEEQIVAFKKDNFVIRNYSPVFTIGGGTIINENSPKHKRFKEEVIENLLSQSIATPEEIVEDFLGKQEKPYNIKNILQNLNMEKSNIEYILETLVLSRRIYKINELYLHEEISKIMLEKINQILTKYHKKFPLRLGIFKEELRSQSYSEINNKEFYELLSFWEEEGEINIINNQYLCLTNFQAKPKGVQIDQITRIIEIIKKNGFQAININDVYNDIKITEKDRVEFSNYFSRENQIVFLTESLVISNEAYVKVKETIIEYLKKTSQITVSEAKELINVNRKTIIPLLELLDEHGITKRIEDKRVLKIQ